MIRSGYRKRRQKIMWRIAAIVCLSVAFEAARAVIPVDAFVQRPAISEVRVAPDGAHVLYIASDSSRQRVQVVELDGPQGPRSVLDADSVTEIPWCRWI